MESQVLSMMDQYIDVAKNQLKRQGIIYSALFFFYKNDHPVHGTFNLHVEPVGFHVTSKLVLKQMQITANDKVKTDKNLLAVGLIQDIFYKRGAPGNIPLNQDPESMFAIYSCVYFPVRKKMEKTTFYKRGFEKQVVFEPEESEDIKVYDVIFFDQPWNMGLIPVTSLFLDPFEIDAVN